MMAPGLAPNPDVILTYLLKEASLLLVWPSLNASSGWGDI